MQNILRFDRARNCVRYLIKKFKIEEMYIPYYLCDVIRHTLFEEGCKPLFYHIDDDFLPVQKFPEDSYILYPNYFGVFGENVDKLAEIYPKLIADNAHAFFDEPKGFACFNSGVKFGLGENAYLMFGKNLPEQKDYEDLKEKLNTNFLNFHQKYSSINLLKINTDRKKYPFCYPLLVSTTKEADEIVKKLEKQGYIIYRYWNNLPVNFNEYKFYSRLIPIPVAR